MCVSCDGLKTFEETSPELPFGPCWRGGWYSRPIVRSFCEHVRGKLNYRCHFFASASLSSGAGMAQGSINGLDKLG